MLTWQPQVLVLGDSILNPHQVFTLVNQTVYELKSIHEAVEICFKCFFVFNMQYPKTAQLAWYFVQKYIFGIDSFHDSAIKKTKYNEIIGQLTNI